METNGDSLESERKMETIGIQEYQRDYWRLMETNGNYWDSEWLLETHETNGD